MILNFITGALAVGALPYLTSAASASSSLADRQDGGLFECAGQCLNTDEIGDACNIDSVGGIGDILNADDGLVQCVCNVTGGDNSTLSDCMGDCGLGGYYDSLIERCDETSSNNNDDNNSDNNDDNEDAAAVFSPSSLLLSGGLCVIALMGENSLPIFDKVY